MKTVCSILAILLSSVQAMASAVSMAPAITFEQRVEAQRAIERVYYSHLDGARRPFEQVVTQELLERKVRTYLKQSAALEEFWGTPITAKVLQAEATRIARDSRFPDRLAEILTALGGDEALFQETLVRATIADRLSHSYFYHDERVHGDARAEAATIHMRLMDGTLDAAAGHPRRQLIETSAGVANNEEGHPFPTGTPMDAITPDPDPTAESTEEEPEILQRTSQSSAPVIGPMVDEIWGYTTKVQLPSEDPSVSRHATYTVPKRTWDDWWAAQQVAYDETAVAAVAGGTGFSLHLRASAGATSPTCGLDDTWQNGALDAVPDPRYGHAAFWTGSEMLVWGGVNYTGSVRNGGRYDPLTDSWRLMSQVGSPAVAGGKAVWTGREMIAVGGYPASGGRYDPTADSWSPISSQGTPTSVVDLSVVWTGSEMILWGGGDSSNPPVGGRYDLATDTWRPVSLSGAPSGRRAHTAVWTGTEMIVWGGQAGYYLSSDLFGDGARYNPATDTWITLSMTNAPFPRSDHTAVWADGRMIVWGGRGRFGFTSNATLMGDRYDPVSDTWSPISSLGAPSPRRLHSAVWTGERMLIWGGAWEVDGLGYPFFNTSPGASYLPATDSWEALTITNEPFRRSAHSAVWTGSEMFIWGGGYGGGGNTFTSVVLGGGRYIPSNGSWVAISGLQGNVASYSTSPIVWTGSEILLWSGGLEGQPGLGARYDPLTESWHALPTSGAPESRFDHVSVWTGQEMFVWGGQHWNVPANSGGLYDPTNDSWRPSAPDGAPLSRSYAGAVWTGSEVIVWGGRLCFGQTKGCLNFGPGPGGRYNPFTDSWRLMPMMAYFPPVAEHSTIWTGREMIVFGGYWIECPAFAACATLYSSKGARYDPARDEWTALPALPTGQERSGHNAVWTGREMIVVGGFGRSPLSNPQPFSSGWRYDRTADLWEPVSVPSYFPYRPVDNSAVWTGRHILIWGSEVNLNNAPGFGGIYDTVTGTWRPISFQGQITPRRSHTAAWTGDSMIVWGGFSASGSLHNGARYIFGQDSDDDGDGLTECGGDCKDADPFAYPGADEVCNGRDDTCDGLIDEDSSGTDSDADGIANVCDACPAFANPGQSDPLGCIAATGDGGSCLETGVSLASPLPEGTVTVVRAMTVLPTAIHFELNVSSCELINPIHLLLNGEVVGTFLEPRLTCDCVVPLYRVSISDPGTIARLWRTDGDNVLGVRKPEPLLYDYLGTWIGWIRVMIDSAEARSTEMYCLVDGADYIFHGADPAEGTCTTADQCIGGAVGSALEESLLVPLPLMSEVPEVTAPFVSSQLPRTVDLRSVQDGPVSLCVGERGGARLYAATASGDLHRIETATGTASSAGGLGMGIMSLANDGGSRRTWAQGTRNSVQGLIEIDLSGVKTSGALTVLTWPLTALGFHSGRLFGIESSSTGVRLLKIDSSGGVMDKIGVLPAGSWDGLTHLYPSVEFLSARTFNGQSSLWGIDVYSGAARSLAPLPFQPSALEYGPDGLLYATRNLATDSELHRIDPLTGVATFIGMMGVRDVVSLATVRNLPRACLDIVKQGEQTLAINGACNTAPTAVAGGEAVVECSSFAGGVVTLDGTGSTDPDSTGSARDDIVQYEWFEGFGSASETILGTGEILQATLPLGEHAITLRVTDSQSATDSDDRMVSVRDTVGPRVDVTIDPGVLWPPNHRMIPVSFTAAAIDACDAAPQAGLLSVVSSEADDNPGEGDGHTTDDVQSASPGAMQGEVLLRAERSGSGAGRLYSIHFGATDASGNPGTGEAVVLVPHDQGGTTEPIDLGVTRDAGSSGLTLAWSAVEGAHHYNVLRGSVSRLSGAGSYSVVHDAECVAQQTPDLAYEGTRLHEAPAVGEAFFYLVEYFDGRHSGYGTATSGGEILVASGDACH